MQLPIYQFTPEGYENLKKEQAKLQHERPEVVEELQKARELGDLSENGRYKAARAQLSFLDGRLRHLERLIRFGKVIIENFEGKVCFGCKVVIDDGNGPKEFEMVGSYEANPAKNKLSVNSPIGQALMDKRKGETVKFTVPAGKVSYKIVDIKAPGEK
ncbi:hypothetical protein A2160_01765 [Candidatus Beckwithbacteria bacterium RBG_13_42_9]|uniref:Transcription elongation factor GreA n=1 Tax=Candidatus Beckwithbacteria bacterium RBG_13_42_9 TaxID=1797457 RepID=A0A1F5E8D8_9BACT|nr:MAG: hypothetical protein A2160_01765 [Candidatus Beckwithbacteria bacterium RBG_13_42_9]